MDKTSASPPRRVAAAMPSLELLVRATAHTNRRAIRRTARTMGTDMMRWLASLVLEIALSAAAHAAHPSPMVGVLAPEDGSVAFHAVRGWQPTERPLRVLDEAGRPLCCLRVGHALTAPSNLRVDDMGRGARYAVKTEGKLARRLTKRPILAPVLAPVLRRGVTVGKTDSKRTHLRNHGRRWTLERCLTSEGERLTTLSTEPFSKTVYYFPLGYDVKPTCR